MAWFGFQLFMLFLRGPHVKRYTWFGYEGGLEARKSVVTAREMAESKAAAGEDGSVVREKSDVEKDQVV